MIRFLRAGAIFILIGVTVDLFAQLPFAKRPEFRHYDEAIKVQRALRDFERAPEWDADGYGLTYAKDGKGIHLKVDGLVESPSDKVPYGPLHIHTPDQMYRGPQISRTLSPDRKWRVVSREGNVFLQPAEGNGETALTHDGGGTSRVRYGIASWVYREELDVSDAMWWSPDSRKVAFYRFDESQIPDYFVVLNQSAVQDYVSREAYPVAGAANPKVSLLIYDLDRKTTTAVQSGFDDPSLGEYLYDVRWAPDGSGLLYERSNRKQNRLDLCLCDPATGLSRVVVTESQPQSWVDLHPEIVFLKDGHRFVWSSERDGFKNYRLFNLAGNDLGAITSNKFDAIVIEKIDEARNLMYYSSYGADMPYLRQLHRVGLDGVGDRQLTDGAHDHVTSLAPNDLHFIDMASTIDSPPQISLMDDDGNSLKVLVKSDLAKVSLPSSRPSEVFSYLAADGKTTLYGTVRFPTHFNARRRYPVLLDVYAGPESDGIDASFQSNSEVAELGFLHVSLAGRGTMGRGKAFRDALYEKLGVVEIDDLAAGIRALEQRPYVDGARIGVFGTSYGGYATIMCLVRHPELFAAGCASSSVTSWRNYDSIYTERYDGLPTSNDNEKGYEAGSAMNLARELTGRLMLYFGTGDDNVHPSNTLQLTRALSENGRRYEMQVGADESHSEIPRPRMWEFFLENLVDRAPAGAKAGGG